MGCWFELNQLECLFGQLPDEGGASRWNEHTFRHRFLEIKRAAGLPADLQYRDLRATAATELADGGADVIDMSTHTTHADVASARRYARRTSEQFRRAAGKRLAARKAPENG